MSIESFKFNMEQDKEKKPVLPIEGPKEVSLAVSVEEFMTAGYTREEAEEEVAKREADVERLRKIEAQKMRQVIKRDTGESPQM